MSVESRVREGKVCLMVTKAVQQFQVPLPRAVAVNGVQRCVLQIRTKNLPPFDAGRCEKRQVETKR